ncbi:receptor-like protein Cf-9 homolog [Pistacia vera]|uniref:receptor-like protein Cf-9 homolog n=1 Tax=Pistacia vera TaxID=55513 RepID=UPI0012638B88|nr:receptor-like protein Cf-9 homolog [Pistacia vera]
MAWYLTWSCQIFCLLLLLLHSQCSAKLCSHDQSSALLQFKQLFSLKKLSPSSACDKMVPSYSKLMSWKEDKDCCLWDGVTCDTVTGHVIELDLSCSWLYGSIPSNSSLFFLPHLRRLNLAFNNFNSSQISSAFNKFPSLRLLNLSSSNFHGQLPSEISHLTKLISLDLSHNHLRLETPVLYGLSQNLTELKELILDDVDMFTVVPSFLVSSLQNLVSIDYHDNLLNGTIPSGLFILPLLEFMDLSYNQFAGCIHEFQNNSLREINLSNNRLSGSIPSSIFELVNLIDLELSSNNLSGILELYMFAKLKNLETLALSHNNLSLSTMFKANSSFLRIHSLKLSSCNLSEFSDIFRRLDRIEFLDLSNNKIQGQIPSWVWNMGTDTLNFLNLSHNFLTVIEKIPCKNLEYLDLHSNLLEGSLPVPPSDLKVFLISNNTLIGKIPQLICNMSLIQILDLSNNKLSGRIPECIGNFSNNLSVLDLRQNRFYGTLPGTFMKDNNLRTLNFNNNQLEGTVPRSLINCTMLEVIDLGNNKIHDAFPYWLGDLPVLQVLVLHSNMFYGSITHFGEKVSFPQLRIFYLSSNSFTGSLPTRYFENLNTIMNAGETEKKLKYMGDTYY